jgi:hypothetical protein
MRLQPKPVRRLFDVQRILLGLAQRQMCPERNTNSTPMEELYEFTTGSREEQKW